MTGAEQNKARRPNPLVKTNEFATRTALKKQSEEEARHDLEDEQRIERGVGRYKLIAVAVGLSLADSIAADVCPFFTAILSIIIEMFWGNGSSFRRCAYFLHSFFCRNSVQLVEVLPRYRTDSSRVWAAWYSVTAQKE